MAATQQQQQAAARNHVRGERLCRPRQLRKRFFKVLLSENKYTVQQISGEGANGVVCSALDNETGETVAVKRVKRGFDNIPVSVRLLREIKFEAVAGPRKHRRDERHTVAEQHKGF